MNRSKMIFIIVWLVIVACGKGFCATIIVDQSGGGDYTTITAGITAAYAGDVIKVWPGVYEENVVVDKDIDLIGSGPKYTTIIASDNGITVNDNRTTHIANFTISAGINGVYFDQASTGVVKNCVVVGCGNNGISQTYLSSVTLINNTIVYCSNAGMRASGSSTPNVVQGNIIAFNGAYGIRYGDNISYNNVYGNSLGSYNNCSAGTGDISQSPLFTDQDNGIYTLQSSSPCIDTGIPGESYNDPDGTRNDMGAYSSPNSAAFWPYVPDGPVVTEIEVTPASVPRGGTITIQAKGRVQ